MDTAIVLYGPPAAGKDTVTAALGEIDPSICHYQRLKTGPGRTAGYRMASAEHAAKLAAAGDVIYTNQRYDATYVTDRPELARLLAAGNIPVLHVGQPEAIDALLAAAPAVRWVVVELWCARDVSAARSAARGTGDTAARLAAWDATPRLGDADVHIDTAIVDPADAARQIIAAVQAARSTIVVPTMHLIRQDGTLDLAATRRYAVAASGSWVDIFLLNGSTTSGDLLSPDERATVLDIWLEAVDTTRLLACSWSDMDYQAAAARHVTPMAAMTASDLTATQQLLQELPAGSTIYSHPALLGYPFTPELAAWAKKAGHLPAGGKLAKVQPQEIHQIRSTAPEFALWDGSSRHIRRSVDAGAAGVVATPLSAVLADLPPRSLSRVQPSINTVQAALDQLPDRLAKRYWLLDQIKN
uniref:hypothetical protein n=1 Tax=Nocardia sp. CA-095871 TaxID=3239971 RepID=UPI003F49929D